MNEEEFILRWSEISRYWQQTFEKPIIEPQEGKRMAVKRDIDDVNIMQLVKVSTNEYKTG